MLEKIASVEPTIFSGNDSMATYRPPEIEWDYYRGLESWFLTEACALMLGIDPYGGEADQCTKCLKAVAAARSAIKRGELRATEFTEEEAKRLLPWPTDAPFEVLQRDFVAWWLKNHLDVSPDAQVNLLPQSAPTTKIVNLRLSKLSHAKQFVQWWRDQYLMQHPGARTGQVLEAFCRDDKADIGLRDCLGNVDKPKSDRIRIWLREGAPDSMKRRGRPAKK